MDSPDQKENSNIEQEDSHRPLEVKPAQNTEQQYEFNEEHQANTYVNMEHNQEEEEEEKGQEKEGNEQKSPELEFQKCEQGEPETSPPQKLQQEPIITEEDKEWILKQASMQRIGGTYDFFTSQTEKYKKHLSSRKTVLNSIFTYLEMNKITKAKTLILLKQYFEDLAQVCQDFHKKSYKYEAPIRDQPYNPILCMRTEMKEGFDILFSMRRNVGNQHSRINKMIKDNIVVKLEKEMNVYWGVMFQAEKKAKEREEKFKQQESQILKRIEKIGKVYQKGRYGEDLSEDVFVEMTKFVKDERQLRTLIYDWGRQLLGLRKAIINADFNLITSFDAIVNEFKNFKGAIFQSKKQIFNFEEQLKEQIFKKYKIENMCTPLDNDYISAVLNFKKKTAQIELTSKMYEQFLNEEYFQDVIGDFKEMLKGTIKKTFPLKNSEEQLIRSVSDNFVLYNKKSLQIKNKLVMANTKAVYQGGGRVLLTELVKGIIFDSKNTQEVTFSSGDRAEELVMSMEAQFGLEEAAFV